ncbi:DNA replication licensing factor, MCM2 component [Trachipleistophora hominis]|uniref:DNA replication licensing factor MCM2 n=1 Tax=Trachipleistophora hominis TaxID=72359 RepID=L7JSM1_TRAHO|nr:DNA replication licensing factor, MCM2 component [Trachipleistophora hominis]
MAKRKYEEFTSDQSSVEDEVLSYSQSTMSDMQSDVPIDLPSAADIYLESSVPENYNDVEVPENEENEELPVNKEVMENESYKLKIKNLFAKFLSNYGGRKYIKLIKTMCAENGESLLVSYTDMESFDDLLVRVLVVCAEPAIEVFDDALRLVVLSLFPNYFMIRVQVHVRVIDVPVVEELRELRNENLGCLVRIRGIVTRRSGVFPRLFLAKFICTKCRCTFGPFLLENDASFRPQSCLECQSRGPFLVNEEETVYRDFQKMTVQEIPGTVPAGTLPRSKDVLVFHDLIDLAKPGDEIELTGIYKSGMLNDTIFTTHIIANAILRKESSCVLTREDEKEIKRLARNPRIVEILSDALAPEVCGHPNVKRACLLALFGGQPKGREKENDKASAAHRIRGDINVLIMGDPGTAKSQLLRSLERVAPRAVLATGHGVSSVGLTASVRKDSNNEWMLEGGALVLADNGIVLIDEFDKMQENDRSAIHEAMEQQSISVSKAGIVASLNARCAVVAAANPRKGRYNNALSLNANVNLSEPILSRFDILCVVRDVTDQVEDERIASFILKGIRDRSCSENASYENQNGMPSERSEHGPLSTRSEPISTQGTGAARAVIDDDLFKKYLIYAKRIHPQIKEIDKDKISKLYAELRKESDNSMPITARHIESIVRISEALARIKLNEYVCKEDIDTAIKITLDSFISAQKYSVVKTLRKKFAKYLNENDDFFVYLFILNEMFNDKIKSFRHVPNNVVVDKNEFEKRVRGFGIKFNYKFYKEDVFAREYNLTDSSIRREIVY